MLVLSKIHDHKAIQQILDEVAGDVPAAEFLQHYNEATSQPYRPLVWEADAKKHVFRAGGTSSCRLLWILIVEESRPAIKTIKRPS